MNTSLPLWDFRPVLAKWGVVHILAVPHLSRGWSKAKAREIGQKLGAICASARPVSAATAIRTTAAVKPGSGFIPTTIEPHKVRLGEKNAMTKDDLDNFIRSLPGVTVKDLKSRTSYWRSNGSRFCKIEQLSGGWIIVFTDLSYAKDGRLLPNSEPDTDGRLMLRLTNSLRIEDARTLIEKQHG